jgi:hypothetical protein
VQGEAAGIAAELQAPDASRGNFRTASATLNPVQGDLARAVTTPQEPDTSNGSNRNMADIARRLGLPPETELPSFMMIDPDEPWQPPVVPAQPAEIPRAPADAQPEPTQPMNSGGKKTTKAAIKITALNIRGNGKDRKWFKLNQIMNERRAGIMIVGEAHLSDVRLAAVERTFARQLEIRFSSDPHAKCQRCCHCPK